MPRSPTDATRFTATGPYQANKSSSSASSTTGPTSFSSNPQPQAQSPAATSSRRIDVGAAGPSAPPANETPQQKIARLRAAAALARRGKESAFEQTVRIGRAWADRAHRLTAWGLIGLTLVSGVVAAAGITDMLLHNRRRRNEWLAEQQAKTARDLAFAKRAESLGEATEDQILLINRERAAEEAAAAKANRPGAIARATGWLAGGLAEVETKGGKLGAAAASQVQEAAESTASQAKSAVAQVQAAAQSTTSRAKEAAESTASQAKSAVAQVQDAVDARRRQGERVEATVRPAGGPLDQHAHAAAAAAADTARSWTSWLTRR